MQTGPFSQRKTLAFIADNWKTLGVIASLLVGFGAQTATLILKTDGLQRSIDRIEHLLNGNGQPGLVRQVNGNSRDIAVLRQMLRDIRRQPN